MSELARPLTTLVVDADPKSAAELARLVKLSGVSQDVHIVYSAAEGREIAASRGVKLCIIGSSLGVSNQQRLCLSLEGNEQAKDIKLLVVTNGASEKDINNLTASGAHSVLTNPVDADALELAVSSVIPGYSSTTNSNGGDWEQITSLPWILQGVATRLKQVAERLEQEQASRNGALIKSNPKLLKETLLAVFANRSDDEVVEQLVEMISKQQEARS